VLLAKPIVGSASTAKFYSVNALFGISLREVNSVCSDSYGFIWASSKTGILRIMADDYRIYQLPYENANVITVKLICTNSRLLAYTNNGQIFLFNQVLDRFELMVDIGRVLKSQHVIVQDLLQEANGALWIASSEGFFKYEFGKLMMLERFESEDYFITWFDDQYLILVRNEGIWLWNRQNNTKQCIYENHKVNALTPSSLCYDAQSDKLWIGTISNGLFAFDWQTKSFYPVLEGTFPKQPILAIEKKSGSALFVGIDGRGIWELNKDERLINVYNEQVDDPSSLKGNGVYDIFCDQNNRIWVCSYSGGLSFFDETPPQINQITHHINSVNSLGNNDVNSIIQDRSGKLWFATNNGISCWDVETNQWRHFYNKNNQQSVVFLTLCEDDMGRIWAGSYSLGVFVLDEKSGAEIAHYPGGIGHAEMPLAFIFDICKDSQGDIWIGGGNGEYVCYQVKQSKFRAYSREPVRAFAEVSPGQLLLGCSYGLLSLEKSTGISKRLLIGFSIRDVLVKGDEAWVCTGGDGLVKYNLKTETTEKFNVLSGMPSNFVNSIEYADGYYWLGTENGCCRFNPKDKSFLTYSAIYPLSRTSFNSAAHFKLNNGSLAWGTNSGAVLFAPSSLQEMPAEGKIYFQDLLVAGSSVRDSSFFDLKTPVDSLESINLNYHQNTISLEVLSLKANAGAKFSWKLDGFDKSWSVPSDNRFLTYTNIPNGNFVLRIKLYDSSLSKVVAERSLVIKVIPPFWKSYWFWIIIYVIVIGLLLLVLQYYIRSLKQKHTEEKVRFFTNTAHDIRTSLTLIKAPVEELSREPNLSAAGKHYLGIAIEQARRLSMVVTQLMDFQKVDIGKEQLSYSMIDVVAFVSNRLSMFESVAKNKNVELLFKPVLSSYFTAVDEPKMERIIDNLVSNAIKYSNAGGRVVVDLQGDEKKWSFSIKDDGIGINKSAQRRLFKEFYRAENAINSKVVGSGIGLLLVKNYVTMHKGTITCHSQENKGSTFQFEIPHIDNTSESTPDNRFAVSDSSMIPAYDVVSQMSAFEEEPQEPEMKVLIVEDNDDLLSFMQSTLSREFKVFTAVNGIQALEVIDQQMPDLIVSDIMMPEMDGFELCQKLKSTYETSHIPVVLLTALSEKTEQLKGLGLGADDYLTKPFDMNLLVQRIKSIIRNRSVVREKALRLGRISPSEPIVANELNDKFMKKMMDVAKANIANSEFNKDEFASAMNVSSSLLYKKIKSLTNLSPTDFIKVVRLEYSLELLRSRQYNVTEVSELCGFTSVGYFSTVFRKHYGKSPTEIID